MAKVGTPGWREATGDAAAAEQELTLLVLPGSVLRRGAERPEKFLSPGNPYSPNRVRSSYHALITHQRLNF